MVFQKGLRGLGDPVITAPITTQTPYQIAIGTGMTDAEAQMYLPFPQNAAACEADRYYSKDPSGKTLFGPYMVPGSILAGGIAAIAMGHPIIGAILAAIGLNELPIWGCTTVPPGNSCPGYTECTSFMCRNGGCGW